MDARPLLPNSQPAHPPRVPLPDHVHRLVALDRTPRRLHITNPLRGVHASCDRSVIRLHDGVHVVDRSGAATALPDAFLLHAGNRRAVAACAVRVDDAGPRMRRIRQRLAEQAVGRRGSAPPRAHAVDRSASGIEGAGEGAPTAPDTNVGLSDTPGPLGGLEMTAQPLLQLGTGVLDPAPDGRVWSASRPRSRSRSSPSRNESESRRYQRTAHRISSGSVCRHVKIAGRMACFTICSGYQPPLAEVATQPTIASCNASRAPPGISSWWPRSRPSTWRWYWGSSCGASTDRLETARRRAGRRLAAVGPGSQPATPSVMVARR